MENITRYDYKVHPLAQLFPELPPDEFEKLKEDIRIHGQLEKIVISRDKLLLDGRHKMKACQELGITPRTCFLADVPNAEKMSEAEFIWSRNFLRRHLTEDQRAAIAAEWLEGIEKAAKDRQTAGLKKGDIVPVGVNSPNGERTRQTIAKAAHTSEHKARQAIKVAKSNPEGLKKVQRGEMKLKDATPVVRVKFVDTKFKISKVTYHSAAEDDATEALLSPVAEWMYRMAYTFTKGIVKTPHDPAKVRAELSSEALHAIDALYQWLGKILNP